MENMDYSYFASTGPQFQYMNYENESGLMHHRVGDDAVAVSHLETR